MIETLRQLDHQLFYLVNQGMANSFFDFLCPALRGKSFLIAFYCVIAYRVYQMFPKHFIHIAIAGAITFLLTDQLSATVIKSIFQRIRPCNNPEIMARLIVDHCGGGFSFVSAHAANSFGMAAFLISVSKRKVRALLVLGIWATLVSFSQVYVGVHFPADVIGGALLGVLIGSAVALGLKKFVEFRRND